MTHRFAVALALGAAAAGALPRPAPAQASAAGHDTLRLGALQDAAVGRDPRTRQLALLESQSSLRLRSIGSERLPRIDARGLAQYQSEVVSIPFEAPGGAPFTPHKDTYDAHLGVRQPLLDPAIGARRAVERARLAESQAQVHSTLYSLRQAVADAYFGILLLDEQRRELGAGIADLEARLRVARERVSEGDALPSESAALEAELLRRRQSLAGIAADRAATLAVLGDLTGRELEGGETLAVPDLAGATAGSRSNADTLRRRPEYAQFARARQTLGSRAAEIGRRSWPRLSAIARAGVGRPGLNPLGDEFGAYWLAGLQVEWSPFDWGRTGLEREALAVQQEIVTADEAAFAAAIRRTAVRELATVGRIEEALAADSAIIALHEKVLGETRLRFDEGVVTSAELVDRETDLLSARLARATHRVELARARARFLILVGLEVD
jgi:outer membrane protein TolC